MLKFCTVPALVGMLCLGCTVETVVDPGDRLVAIGYKSDGSRDWYDTEREEYCAPYQTERDGVRCIPEFVRIHGSQLGYADSVCANPVAWADFPFELERYVAYVDAESRILYSISRILGPGQEPSIERYEMRVEGCAVVFSDEAASYLYITPAIHMSNFAVVQ